MAEAGAEVAEEVQGGWDRTVKDLTSGAAGGIAQVLIGELRSFLFIGAHALSGLVCSITASI